MKRLLIFILFSASFFFSISSSAWADNDYPVAFWGEKHIGAAMALHRALTPDDFRISCNSGKLVIRPKVKNPAEIAKDWRLFAGNKQRMAYCRSQPGKTWYLLGEAPYFMLPEKPGLHK